MKRRCLSYELVRLIADILCLKELFLKSAIVLLQSQITLVEDIGVEPMTPCVQGRCSSQLS